MRIIVMPAVLFVLAVLVHEPVLSVVFAVMAFSWFEANRTAGDIRDEH